MEYKMVKKMRAGGGTQISDEKRGRAYDRARVNEKVAKDYREAKGITNKPFAKVTELVVNAVQKLKGDSPDGDKPRDRYQTIRDFKGKMSKDAKQKAATNKAVSVAMDSKYEGKINPPKEPDMGVARGSKKYQVGYGPDHPKAKSALAPETSSRPKPRPKATSALAPKTSSRPKPRPKSMEEDDYGAVDRGNRAAQLEGFNYGGKVSKMAMGGKARGMGAATKGGSFSKNG
jgi:hypothetical protein